MKKLLYILYPLAGLLFYDTMYQLSKLLLADAHTILSQLLLLLTYFVLGLLIYETVQYEQSDKGDIFIDILYLLLFIVLILVVLQIITLPSLLSPLFSHHLLMTIWCSIYIIKLVKEFKW